MIWDAQEKTLRTNWVKHNIQKAASLTYDDYVIPKLQTI